ncbi:diacylglycerol kinase theta [Stigmatopora argus]
MADAVPEVTGTRERNPSSLGHSLKRVTLTKPTYCHHCSDFLWGLIGFLCEACNLTCHEKCLKTLHSLCTGMAPSAVQTPVAHCFGPDPRKKRVCFVCRKQTEGKGALRCQVCELHVHAECVSFTCADCRSCHTDGTQNQDTFGHHWREGNLPAGARCCACRRSCGSSDVLAGLRCEWCNITCHAACYPNVASECTTGRLRRMMLHPACVRLQSRHFSKRHCFRIAECGGGHQLGEGNYVEVCNDSPSAAAVPEHGLWRTLRRKDFLKVYDGDDALRRGDFRPLFMVKPGSSREVLEVALRTFYLPGHPQKFRLEEVGRVRRLCGKQEPPTRDGGDAWTLRARDSDAEVIRVYGGPDRSDWDYVSVSVSKDSTAASVLAEVLNRPELLNDDATGFDLREVLMNGRQVQSQTLTPQQNILEKLRDLRKVSLRQMNQTRFYVAERRSQEVRISLLIGGLPTQLSKEHYWQLLQEELSIKSHLVEISHVYGTQGALALRVTCFSEAERLFMLAKDTRVEDKPLFSLVVPGIQVSLVDMDVRPLLVFVNTKSGGLKGKELLYAFRKILNPHQVFDLSLGGPLPGLHTFRALPRFRVLVCGGDGTVGWVLSALEDLRHRLVCQDPPVAIVPLGTGNDLSRVLRWGAGYGGEDPSRVLHCVDQAEEVLMDRWTVLLDAQDHTSNGSEDFLEAPKIVHMNNYLGVGIDAELSLDFHQARLDHPNKFSSRFHNKGVYVKVGLQKISATRSLHRELQLRVDDRDVPLPNIEGLIFLNIPSWGSGADLWGSEADAHYAKPSLADGLLEVVGVTGVVHMGQVQSGLRSGIRIAQGSYMRVTLKKAFPVQVDGEPWLQAPGHIIVSAAGTKVRMLKKSNSKHKSSSGTGDGRSESSASSDDVGC